MAIDDDRRRFHVDSVIPSLAEVLGEPMMLLRQVTGIAEDGTPETETSLIDRAEATDLARDLIAELLAVELEHRFGDRFSEMTAADRMAAGASALLDLIDPVIGSVLTEVTGEPVECDARANINGEPVEERPMPESRTARIEAALRARPDGIMILKGDGERTEPRGKLRVVDEG